jgi:hypothetical protein
MQIWLFRWWFCGGFGTVVVVVTSLAPLEGGGLGVGTDSVL